MRNGLALSWFLLGTIILVWLIAFRLPQHSYMQSVREMVIQVSAIAFGVFFIFNGIRMSRSLKK